MGRGKSWSITEREHLAKAWSRVCSHPLYVEDQKSESFKARLFAEFSAVPDDFKEKGTFDDRKAAAVFKWFKSNISPDVQQFNNLLGPMQEAFSCVFTEQEVINLTVATHVGMDVCFDASRKIDPDSWNNYRAWLVLKKSLNYKFVENSNVAPAPAVPVVDVSIPARRDGDDADGESLTDASYADNNNDTNIIRASPLVCGGVEARGGRSDNNEVAKTGRKRQNQEMLDEVCEQLDQICDTQKQLLKFNQWKIYFSMCNAVGDERGQKRAKSEVEALLGISKQQAAGTNVMRCD